LPAASARKAAMPLEQFKRLKPFAEERADFFPLQAEMERLIIIARQLGRETTDRKKEKRWFLWLRRSFFLLLGDGDDGKNSVRIH